MSRYYKPVLLCALALTAACAGENPAAPASVASIRTSTVAAAAVSRPAGGRCTTTIIPDFSQIRNGILLLDITGVCNLKHLGRATMAAHQIVYVGTGDITNETIYTAANGDSFHSTFTGTDPLHNAVFTGNEVYHDGTGRFVGVSGGSYLSGSASLATWTGQYTTTGTISY